MIPDYIVKIDMECCDTCRSILAGPDGTRDCQAHVWGTSEWDGSCIYASVDPLGWCPKYERRHNDR